MTEPIAEEKAPGQVYEVAYLVSSNVPEEKVGDVVSRVKTALEKQGAFVLADEFPRFRQLAYTLIKPLGGKNEKHTNAYFGWVKFEVASGNISNIKDDIESDADIVRFLIIKTTRERKTSVRPQMWRHEAPKREVISTIPTSEKKVPTMTEAEIDKTIEELIVE